MALKISRETDPAPSVIAAIAEGLDSFNIPSAGEYRNEPLWLVGRDGDGVIQAGLKGRSFYKWLCVEWLWVAESFRGNGYGTRGPRRWPRGTSRCGRLRNSRSGGPPPAGNEARTRPGRGSWGPRPGRAAGPRFPSGAGPSSGWRGAATPGPAPINSRLLRHAESIAKERGCVGVYLDTYQFQAPNFYRKHGYQEFGRLENSPPGHARIYFSKSL